MVALLLLAMAGTVEAGAPAPVPVPVPAASAMPVPHIGNVRAGQPRYTLDVEQCSWTMPEKPPWWRFRDGVSRPSLRELVAEGVSPSKLERVYVDIPASEGRAPQTCGVTGYALGIMQRFSYALLNGDVVTDCTGGSVIPDGVGQRPDQDPDLCAKNACKKRGGLRKSVTQSHYRAAATGGEKTVKFYRRGFVMNYHRDTNYQMFVVSSLTRWWYMLKLLEAGWPTKQDVSDGTDGVGTITVVLSGNQGGSLQQYEGKHRAAPYIAEMLRLLTKRWNDDVAAAVPHSLRPRIELVPQDGPLFFEELWVPGWAGHNYHYCFLKDVSPPISSVMRLLRDNAFAIATAGASETGSLSEELRALVPSADQLRKVEQMKADCVSAFITRVDVKKQKLDGAARELKDAGKLIKDLGARGFCIVNAAEYTTAEKAVLFSKTKVVVIELGAGLTNLLYVAEGCTVIQISNPVLEDKTRFKDPYMIVQGSWPRQTMAPQMFGHLNLNWEDSLGHHTQSINGGSVNSPFRFKDYAASLAKITQVQQAALAAAG